MRKRTLAWAALSATVLLVLGGASLASGGSVGPNSGGAAGTQAAGTDAHLDGITTLGFDIGAANATAQFYVDVSGASGPLKVSTMDFGVANDHWGVALIDITPGGTGSAQPAPLGSSEKAATKCGNGSTSAFSGKTTLKNPSAISFNGRAVLVVYYCEGVDLFPAGVIVKIDSNGTSNVTSRAASGP